MADEQKTEVQIKAEAEAAAKGKLEFSPEQQAKVQELIDSAYAKAYGKAQAKEKEKDTSLIAAEVATLREQVAGLRGEKKKVALFEAIKQHNVIDASEVVALTESYVRLNKDDSFTILNEQGAERLNAQGKPMSVDEFVDEWVTKRPHHLRAAAGQGAGSAGAKGGNGSGVKIMVRSDYEKMNPTEKMAFVKSEGKITD